MNTVILGLVLSITMYTQTATRKLLLFGRGDVKLRQQIALLEKDSLGMAERDLVVVIVENEAEYEKYKVETDRFALLLIGKDGGEKLRSAKPVEAKAIFKLIDSMPMRQAEKESKENP